MKRRLPSLLLVLCLALPTAAAAAQPPTHRVAVEKIPPARLFAGPGGPALREAEQRRIEALQSRFHTVHQVLQGHHVSQRSTAWLAARGLGPARLHAAADLKQVVEPITLRVLLIRISFETDRSGDLTSVTTDGNFVYEPDPNVHFDPPPHDKAYFAAHLRGLAEYYNIESDGRLEIQSRVLPDGPQDSYKLSDLADYGPGAGGSWTLAMLEKLVVDVIGAADAGTQADGSANLANYDDDDELTYIIFVHAGGDWQSDIANDSPNDVPTFFVTLGEPVPLLGVDSSTGAQGSLSECSIIPESTSQDGWLGSIAGALYHEFGHSLGLPDVYDTSTGLPAVGIWDLMDSGPNLIANVGLHIQPDYPDSIDVFSVAGLLPPSLGAWNRWYLGWLDTETIGNADETVHLPAAAIPRSQYSRWYGGTSQAGDAYDFDLSYPKAIIGGVSPRDFYLVENRWVPLSGADLPDATGIGFVVDDATGVFLYMGGDPVDPDGPGPEPPVSRNTGMYDYFLPDGGLLVWHVNEDRIEQQLPTNTINAYGDGLRLLEADGIQDVGVYEPYVFGFFGSARDPFHAGTTADLYQDGLPSTRAVDRSWTGFEMLGISANTATMTFTAHVLPLAPQPPLHLPEAAAGDTARALDVRATLPLKVLSANDRAETQALLLASLPVRGRDGAEIEPGYLFLDALDGTPLVQVDPSWPAGATEVLTAPLAGPPLLTPVATYMGRNMVVTGQRDGVVRYYLDIVSNGALQTVGNPITVGDTLTWAPAVGRLASGYARLLCCTGDGRLVLLDESGAEIGEPLELSAVVGEATGPVLSPPRVLRLADGDDAFLVLTEGRWFMIAAAGFAGQDTPHGELDLPPQDGRYHVGVLPGETSGGVVVVLGRADAVRLDVGPRGGVTAGPWPASLRGVQLDDPAIADLDGDGRDDVLVVTATRLQAFAANGTPLGGFPVVLRDQFPFAEDVAFAGPLLVVDVDGDGRNEVLATTNVGHLVGWDASGRLLAHLPLLWGDRCGSAAIVGADGAGGRRVWLADAGGRLAPGLGGRPVDGSLTGWLTTAAASRAVGTSQWLGPLGGPGRTGRVGTPRDLGALSAVADQMDRCLVYPNPLHGGTATFRYWSARPGRARVTIYDLEGEPVASLDHEGGEGTIEEIAWRTGALAPGVYLCRLTYPDADGTTTKLLRLAVER